MNDQNRAQSKKISMRKLMRDLEVEIIHLPETADYEVDTVYVNRPGLQFTGYFDHFPCERIQVVGRVEHTYLLSLSPEERKQRMETFMSYEIPALIVSRDQSIPTEMLEAAKKYHRVLGREKHSTTKFIYRMMEYLTEELAPEKIVHGVLVDVDGMGMLLIGESGVGKSETALELIKRNHRLVADDAVNIKRIDENKLLGKAPELTRHFIEIRGLGLLDIKNLYGIGAIKPAKFIDLVVELEGWQDDKYYDRLGLDEEYMTILDVPVEKITIPVKPGRNLAVIVEMAARNKRQKNMGYNSAESFNDNLMKRLKEKE